MRVRSLTVGADDVEVVVTFDPGEPLRTSEIPGAVDRVLSLLPGIGGHHCDGGRGSIFSTELGDTEIAHLLEHAALEVMALAGSPAALRGETSWDFRGDGHGVFRIRLGYDDDLVCLGAVRAAGRVVAWAVGRGEPPDLPKDVRRLRALRKHPVP